jgi:hypothetical protein
MNMVYRDTKTTIKAIYITWALTKRNMSIIQAMDVQYFGNTAEDKKG